MSWICLFHMLFQICIFLCWTVQLMFALYSAVRHIWPLNLQVIANLSVFVEQHDLEFFIRIIFRINKREVRWNKLEQLWRIHRLICHNRVFSRTNGEHDRLLIVFLLLEHSWVGNATVGPGWQIHSASGKQELGLLSSSLTCIIVLLKYFYSMLRSKILLRVSAHIKRMLTCLYHRCGNLYHDNNIHAVNWPQISSSNDIYIIRFITKPCSTACLGRKDDHVSSWILTDCLSVHCTLACFSSLWMLPACKDLFPMEHLCNLHCLYASVPPLSMYMQEHPSTVCILCAFTALLSPRINVIARLSVPLSLFNTTVSILQLGKQTAFHPSSKMKLRLQFVEIVRISHHLCSHPPPSAFAYSPCPRCFPPTPQSKSYCSVGGPSVSVCILD